MHPLCVAIFDSDLGWMALAGSGTTVKQLVIGRASRTGALAALEPEIRRQAREHDWWPELALRLQEYAAGAADDFRDVEVDLDHLTPFAERIMRCCRQIPYGRSLSYGELAAAAGRSRAARAVGNTMAKNRVAVIVPCHRVTHSGGDGGRPGGSCAVRRKLRLLESSGVAPKPARRPKAGARRTGRRRVSQ